MRVLNANIKYKYALTPLPLNNIENIIIHHAEAKIATCEDIDRWHKENGWNGAGYNEYIRKDGTVYIMRGDNVGAHCADEFKDWNPTSYGICCEGNFMFEDMPQAQFQSLVDRIKFNKLRFKNLKKIGGHREFNNSACPGDRFPLEKIKLSVSASKPILKNGSSGQDVKNLQNTLISKGYRVTNDGIFGNITEKQVRQFQSDNSLTADGIVGPWTWLKLQN